MLIYDTNKRFETGPGLFMVPLGITVHTWETAVADDGRGNWWAVVHDGLTPHDGPTRKSAQAAMLDVDSLVGWLETQCIAAKQATGLQGVN